MNLFVKSRTYKILFTIALGVVLLFHFVIQHGIFHKYNFITAINDSAKGKYQIVVIGEREPYDDIRNFVARKFNFNFIYFGCNTIFSEIKDINDYNNIMIRKIKRLNGNNWEVKFRNELISNIIRTECLKKSKV